jgi:hypothetical protein
MRTRRAAPAALFSLAAIGLVTAVMAGCALLGPASPTSTVTGATGQQVTLDWADYPADDDKDPAAVLAAPRAEQVEAVGEQVLTDLQAAVDAHRAGIVWQRGRDGGVYEHDGNGYGGPTMHRTLNSAELLTHDELGDWPALVAVLDAELAEHGYGPIEWEFDREPYGHETAAERDAAVAEQFGSLDPAQMWQWAGDARDGTMWVSIILQDRDRPTAPDASAAEPERLLAIMAGGTVISAADEQAYRDGIAPFEGLEPPDPTHS